MGDVEAGLIQEQRSADTRLKKRIIRIILGKDISMLSPLHRILVVKLLHSYSLKRGNDLSFGQEAGVTIDLFASVIE